MVARPSAILAAIHFHFEGDTQAFLQIRNPAEGSNPGTRSERDKKRTLGYEQPVSAPPGPLRYAVAPIFSRSQGKPSARPSIAPPTTQRRATAADAREAEGAAPDAPQQYGGGTMMSPAAALSAGPTDVSSTPARR